MLSISRQTQQVEARAPLRVARPIDTTALSTTAFTLYAAGADDFVLQHLAVANVTGSAATYTIHIVPAGGAVATSNAVCRGVSLAANTTETVDGLIGHLVQPGATIEALCSVNDAINVFGWGWAVGGEYG